MYFSVFFLVFRKISSFLQRKKFYRIGYWKKLSGISYKSWPLDVEYPGSTISKTRLFSKHIFNFCWNFSSEKSSSSGLDFINVLRTAFTPVVPQSVRAQSSCQYLFTLLGPTSVKAVRRTLMKLTPEIHFIHQSLLVTWPKS